MEASSPLGVLLPRPLHPCLAVPSGAPWFSIFARAGWALPFGSAPGRAVCSKLCCFLHTACSVSGSCCVPAWLFIWRHFISNLARAGWDCPAALPLAGLFAASCAASCTPHVVYQAHVVFLLGCSSGDIALATLPGLDGIALQHCPRQCCLQQAVQEAARHMDTNYSKPTSMLEPVWM